MKRTWAMPFLFGLMLTGCAGATADAVEDEDIEEVGIAVAALAIDGSVPSQKSAWSGASAALKATLSRPASSNDYVHGFSMAEDSDDPCHFAVLYNDVDDPTQLEGNEVWDRCAGGAPADYLSDVMPNSFRTTGVAVCLNSARDKMKGFALIGRYPECILDPNGTTPDGDPCNGAGPREEADEAERPHCPGSRDGLDGDWEDEAECPPGYVVTGIEINHRAGGGNRRMMSGVRAICHLLEE
ncbi:MAG: hypothetical protein HOV80_20575 [Polyangiaceae bacterium]|nr:hypothetical protein [Polyangiaceae bacterium]